ncbi:MAG: hypothetical protein NT085_03640 [candidate division SR1 bacterium]|nr:hypothetical protein [candidate division SR1 bacterium]
MIKTLTQHYRKIPGIGRVLLGILFFFGVFVATFRFLYADFIPFESNLSTIFPWLNTGYYSNTHFMYGGNNFVGIIFWSGSETVSPVENITINGGAQSINCSTHLRGIYYNNQRGRRIWPLDTGNLALLSGSLLATGYDTMTITGGFYTNCVTAGGGYIPALNEVYGQIDHTLLGQTGFRMIAGVNYNFTGNAISGLTFGHTLTIATGGVHTGYIFDTNGGIAELNMNVPWCQSFESIPAPLPITILQGSGIQFICQGQNVSGYILSIGQSGNTIPFYNNSVPNSGPSQRRLTGTTLATGDYRAACTVLLPIGLGGPQCETQIPFHVGGTGIVVPTGTGCNPNFQGEISFASSGSTVINPSLATYYTNKTGIIMQLAATEPTHFVVSGDFLGTPWTGDYLGTGIYTPISTGISLTGINTWNYFVSTYTTGLLCSYIDANKRVYVDTLPPTTPTILSPANGTNSCPSTPLNVTRSVSYDTGSQLGSLPVNYRYEIYSNSGMTTTGFILSGTTTTTGAIIPVSLLPLGTYYMRIVAIDMVGNTAASTILNFTTSQQYCTAGTGIVIVTPTIWLRNVDLDKIYRSDPIWILGLTGPTLINISKGMLFINNGTGLGTTGIVTSTDTIYIEVVSSNKYDTTVTSNLTIAGLTGTFSVTTKKNGCTLTAAEKLVIQNIYADLKDQYNNDLSKLSEFLNTFQGMVHDESLLSNSCTLEYLLSLIEADLGSNGGIDTSNHITPNCKEYSIGYDITQQAYYAPETIVRYYFINRESLIRHLDYYNPGDCHINTYGNNFRTADTNDSMTHIAPNGKIYHLVGQYGGFSATEFASPKYFDSLASIKMYIDLRNPAKEIWKHILDTTFTPIVFAAPNGREYRIYKTDRGFMSYKLMKVKYYTSLSELKSYINRNNPSKR